MPGMMDAFGRLITLFGTLLECGGIRVTKAALNRLGLPGGYPRRPRRPVDDERLERVLAVIGKLKIADVEGW
jgi:4-hydroxy-tetrahydrodipicolinate synthase